MAAKRELLDAAHVALVLEGYHAPEIVRAERVADGRIEVLFSVEQVGGVRGARTARIQTDDGTPSVIVVRGFPARFPA